MTDTITIICGIMSPIRESIFHLKVESNSSITSRVIEFKISPNFVSNHCSEKTKITDTLKINLKAEQDSITQE